MMIIGNTHYGRKWHIAHKPEGRWRTLCGRDVRTTKLISGVHEARAVFKTLCARCADLNMRWASNDTKERLGLR
jgi:hypothetical protein